MKSSVKGAGKKSMFLHFVQVMVDSTYTVQSADISAI